MQLLQSSVAKLVFSAKNLCNAKLSIAKLRSAKQTACCKVPLQKQETAVKYHFSNKQLLARPHLQQVVVAKFCCKNNHL